MGCLAESNQVILLAVGFGYVGLEFWLGKTDRTKAGSMVELLGIALGFILVQIFKPKKET
jgi:hypothetical protein